MAQIITSYNKIHIAKPNIIFKLKKVGKPLVILWYGLNQITMIIQWR